MNGTIMETRHLDIGYDASRRQPRVVVGNINVLLQKGELVCLVGPNGAGKSTLLRTLVGLQASLRGQVLLNGEEIQRMDAREIAKQLSVVLTDRVDIDNMTVYTLVAMGRYPYTDWTGQLTAHDRQIAHQALETIGITDLASRHVNELSDGERQKVMIARALAQDPYLMVLDEPTAFLDLPYRVEIMHILRRLARESERAILLSTHDLDLALRSADVLWLLPPGGPLQVGAPEDLVLNGAFESTFRRGAIEFDRQTGTFIFQPGNGPLVTLTGYSELHTNWTARALEREGFRIGEGSPLKVNVLLQNGNTRWNVTGNGQAHEYASIREVILYLRNRN